MSSSSGWRGGEEENAHTVRILREELHELKQELVTLKAYMATIVEDQVENRVNDHHPILIQSVKDWIAGGRQGPHPKY
jgi:hypothetical protein